MTRETVILDSEEQYEPPELKVLNVAVIGEDVFLTIMDYSETGEAITQKPVAKVCVPVAELMMAVMSGAVSVQMRAARREARAKEAGT
jgi:hypothetical protein